MKYILVLLLIVSFSLTSCGGTEDLIGKNVNNYSELSESDREKLYAEYDVIQAEVVKKWLEVMNTWLDMEKMKAIEAEGNKKFEVFKKKYSHLQLPDLIFPGFNRFSE